MKYQRVHIVNFVLFSRSSYSINRSLAPSTPPFLILYEKAIRIKVSIFACGRIHSAHLHVKTDLYQRNKQRTQPSIFPHNHLFKSTSFHSTDVILLYPKTFYSTKDLLFHPKTFCSSQQPSVLSNNLPFNPAAFYLTQRPVLPKDLLFYPLTFYPSQTLHSTKQPCNLTNNYLFYPTTFHSTSNVLLYSETFRSTKDLQSYPVTFFSTLTPSTFPKSN